MRKIIWWVFSGMFLAVAIYCYICYNQVQKLQVRNTSLELRNLSLEAVRSAEYARSLVVEQITETLEKDDDKRQEDFRKFSKQLTTLVRENETVRSVLTTPVPRNALDGLQSFPAAGGPHQPATGTGPPLDTPHYSSQ